MKIQPNRTAYKYDGRASVNNIKKYLVILAPNFNFKIIKPNIKKSTLTYSYCLKRFEKNEKSYATYLYFKTQFSLDDGECRDDKVFDYICQNTKNEITKFLHADADSPKKKLLSKCAQIKAMQKKCHV